MSDSSTSSPQWNREPVGGEGTTVFTNVRVLNGSGDNPFMGEVALRGNRIVGIGRGQRVAYAGGGTVIDGGGATLMPGLIDAHLHLSWNNAPGIEPIQLMPPEEHTLNTMYMAKLVLDFGLHGRSRRGGGKAAARRRDPQRDQRRPHSRPALHRGGS